MQDIEIKILKALLKKDFYTVYGNKISKKIFPSDVKGLIKAITYLHKSLPEDRDLTTDEVYNLYAVNTTVTVARLELIREILNRVDMLPEISSDSIVLIIEKLHEKEAARQIADKALNIVQRTGDEETGTTLKDLKEFVLSMDIDDNSIDRYKAYSTELTHVLEDFNKDGDFHLNNGLDFINDSLGRISKGDLIVVFATPNAGKTSFMAQTVVGFLKQNMKVLYCSNEERAHKLIFYMIRNAEQKTTNQILELKQTPIWDNIRNNLVLQQAHGYTIRDIEDCIAKYAPDVVVVDQLDNVALEQKDKLHETLEKLYQKSRLLANKYNSIMFVVSQANDTASGKLYLESNMLANSRIGKQGAADIILGIGMEDIESNIRCINICKNKSSGIHNSIICKLNSELATYIK